MKTKELKILWKVAKSFWIATTLFWIVETIIFLIVEGWHLKATSKAEIQCDSIVSYGWTFCLNLNIITFVYFIINFNKK
jgi:hypothetical protein